MGCGASVPSTNDQQPEANNAPGMRPLIRNRIEEFRRRTRVITMSTTPSSKQLLHDGDEHTDHIDDHSQHDCSPMINEEDLYTEEKSVESEIKKNGGHDQEEEDKKDREITKRQHKEEDEDGEFAPGSPSFRMYYIASVDNSLDSEDSNIGTNKEEEDVHHDENTTNKARRTESIASCEGSVTTLVKKETKGKRFRMGLPNVGQAAVKNLLNVKSCYTPCMNPHAHDNSQMLNNVKVTAT